jgi:hypothetical protein
MLIRRFLRGTTFVTAAVALGTAARFRVGNAITVEAHGGANRDIGVSGGVCAVDRSSSIRWA